MTVELWSRPWALVEFGGARRLRLAPGVVQVPADHCGALWIYGAKGQAPIEGACEPAALAAGFTPSGERRALAHAPLPLRPGRGLEVRLDAGNARLVWLAAPDRPTGSADASETPEELAGRRLMRRAEAVWDRLRDVEDALADPARLWPELRRRWTSVDAERPPQMDVIVRHARTLRRTLDLLERRPRRVLRRTHAQTPLSRVQEVDRRAMQWLARRAGETLAERAGEDQRILAVARREDFDTLENRVLRAYAELATAVAVDYLARNRSRRSSARARRVEEFGRRSRRLARELAARGVRLAEPSIVPNFVLQENAAYHAVWQGWRELLDRERERDELWRWQARSWEEFCALAIMVALIGVPDAQIVAAAPLAWREEQQLGSWIAHDNPLGVVLLPGPRLVVEVRSRMTRPDRLLADFGAPIWLRIGRLDDAQGFLSQVAVWPIWDPEGGLLPGEAAEIAALLPLGRRAQLRACACLRPAPFDAANAASETAGSALAAEIAPDGPALSDGLSILDRWIAGVLDEAGR